MNIKGAILLLEDDKVDLLSLKRAFKEAGMNNELLTAENGEEGLQLLNNSYPLPSLILLDINMPKMTGIEFLKKIKADKRYNFIPVIILTTSNNDAERNEAFRLGIAGYMLKPVEYSKSLEIIKAIKTYWSLSEFPNVNEQVSNE